MNQSIWDVLITGGVLIGLGLTAWAKVSGMTIPELIKSLREIFRDTGEEVMQEAMVWDE